MLITGLLTYSYFDIPYIPSDSSLLLGCGVRYYNLAQVNSVLLAILFSLLVYGLLRLNTTRDGWRKLNSEIYLSVSFVAMHLWIMNNPYFLIQYQCRLLINQFVERLCPTSRETINQKSFLLTRSLKSVAFYIVFLTGNIAAVVLLKYHPWAKDRRDDASKASVTDFVAIAKKTVTEANADSRIACLHCLANTIYALYI